MVTASNDSYYRTPNEEFEYWSKLSKINLKLFEELRLREIERVILRARPECQQRLRKLQWRIDMERDKAKNPIDAMVRLQNMMWRQFYSDNGFVFAVEQYVKLCRMAEKLSKVEVAGEKKKADILPFKKD